MSKHKKGPEKKKAEPGKLEFKMRWMLFSTMIPMAVLIIVLLVVFWQYTNEYNKLSNNLAVSSEYNANYKNSSNDMSFKAEVDMDIYYVTIGRKGKDDLPVKQVNKAIETVERLKTTTTKEERLWAEKAVSLSDTERHQKRFIRHCTRLWSSTFWNMALQNLSLATTADLTALQR